VDVNKAGASIKSGNTSLSRMEQAAGKAARSATVGIDGMTASMVNGAAADNLLADSIKRMIAEAPLACRRGEDWVYTCWGMPELPCTRRS